VTSSTEPLSSFFSHSAGSFQISTAVGIQSELFLIIQVVFFLEILEAFAPASFSGSFTLLESEMSFSFSVIPPFSPFPAKSRLVSACALLPVGGTVQLFFPPIPKIGYIFSSFQIFFSRFLGHGRTGGCLWSEDGPFPLLSDPAGELPFPFSSVYSRRENS